MQLTAPADSADPTNNEIAFSQTNFRS